MPTKQNTTEGQAPVKDARLETMLAKALEQFNAGHLKEASATFGTLEAEAAKAEDLRLGRTVQSYLKAIRTRLELKASAAPQAVELTAQIELNRHDPAGALARVEAALKDQPGQPGLHYLMALALAQQDNAQASAEALTRAIALEAGLIYQFRLETDFDGVRHSVPFATFNRG